VDLAEVVADPGHLEPLAVRVDHPPPDQVVQRRAPQHRLLAAGIHRDVAADARCVERGRIDREDEAGPLRDLGDAAGDHAGLRIDGRDVPFDARQRPVLDRRELLELLGIDDRRARGQRDGATGVAGAAAPWNHRQAELEAAGDERSDLALAVGRQHDERVLDAPVGRVGHVRDAGHAVESDIVLRRQPRQP